MSDVATPVENDDTALRRQAYSAATTRLRNSNREAFDSLVAEEMKARGIEWQPRLTEEQKAEKQLQELLSAHPTLREKVVGQSETLPQE